MVASSAPPMADLLPSANLDITGRQAKTKTVRMPSQQSADDRPDPQNAGNMRVIGVPPGVSMTWTSAA